MYFIEKLLDLISYVVKVIRIKIKYLLIATLAFMLSGCGYTVNYCKEMQYKGIIIHSDSETPDAYCSDGKIINNKYYTNSGEKSIENFTYLEFK